MKRVSIIFLTISLVITISLMSILNSMPVAEATHTSITVDVNVLKNGNIAYPYSTTVNETGSAIVEVDMNKRDEGRFDRFCGGSVSLFTSPTGTLFTCDGKGPWSIEIKISGVTHTPQVTVVVNAI